MNRMNTWITLTLGLFISAVGLAQAPLPLKALGPPLQIPDLAAHGMNVDTKAAENGVLEQVNLVWYRIPFDGSKPMRFDPKSTGLDLDAMDMAYDGQDGYFMVGAVGDSSRKRMTPYLVYFDRHANVVSLNRIARHDNPNVRFWPHRVASFGKGLILISGGTFEEGSKADKFDTAIYNDHGLMVQPIDLPDDVIPNPRMQMGEDGTAMLVRDYTLMDEAARAKVNPNEVLSAELATTSSFVDRTPEGDVLIVRKGEYILSPRAFLITSRGAVKTFRIPALRAAESVSCRFVNGRLATLYDQTEDAGHPRKGVVLVVDTNGNTVGSYEYSAPGVGMLLAGWDGQNKFTFLSNMGDTKNPGLDFITLVG